ncbi:hypothetical protein BG015_000969 [Linnemannia schmuckeri]|uniref:FAD-binding domain-containing protein n=1 Tax=Linnemannia schmuckeri TaxID=64567 RepID=A0A9P5S6G3_9FUNG|nr:hypothetical protein BG015_000969 [Linnemannia schmuckeri]
MDQLGLMDNLMKESVPIRQIRYFDTMEGAVSMEQCAAVSDMLFCETRYGNAIRTIPRSVFINLMISRIPQHKILLGKRVTRTKETTSYMTCYCDDGSEYQTSILVGADGAYSAVRKNMYQNLYESGVLSEEENEGGEEGGMMTADGRVLPHQHCAVGITEPLDPSEFEALGKEYGEFQVFRGTDYEHSIWLMPLTNYRIAWNVFFHFPEDLLRGYRDLQSCSSSSAIDNDENKSATEEFQFSCPGQYTSRPTIPITQKQQQNNDGSWQSAFKRVHDRAQAALETLRDIPNPLSTRQGRFGDLLDKTEVDKISKVTLEQGVSRHWFHGRTVLIGDAAHKSLPYAGQGANQAILDCIALVSKLYLLVKPAPVTAKVTTAPRMPPVAYHSMSTRFRLTFPSLKPHTPKLRLKSKPTLVPTSLPLSSITTTPLPPKWYTPETTKLTQVFQDYYTDRCAIATQATWGAGWADAIFGGHGVGASLIRFAFFRLLPNRLFYVVSDPYFASPAALPFLPDVGSAGTCGGGGGGGNKSRRPSLSTSIGAGMKSVFGSSIHSIHILPLAPNMDTPRTGTGTDPIIRIDVPIQQIEATLYNNNTPIIVRFDNWICTISQQQAQSIMDETGFESDLEVVVALQRPRVGGSGGELELLRMLSQYSHLSVVTTGRNGYLEDDRLGECLQEVTIRRPEMLLRGVKDSVPAFVVSERQHQQQQQQQQHAFLEDVKYRGRQGGDTDTLFVHSCIMSIVTSPAMQSILNSCPPPPTPPPSASTTPFNASSHAFANTHTLSNSCTQQASFHGSEGVFHPALFTFNRHHSLLPLSRRQQQPIREVRFEDVPPEAVRAVIRYIYMGQKPVLEPYCGYTVKDLMALSSYLEISPLEDYCVQLVLGTHRDTGTDNGGEAAFGAVGYNYSNTGREGRGYASWANNLTQRGESKSRISPEMTMQVLFDWGYRYTKIRMALVCALIDSDVVDEEVLFGSPESESGDKGGLLRSFAGHEAFHAIMCEMVEWQLNRRLL